MSEPMRIGEILPRVMRRIKRRKERAERRAKRRFHNGANSPNQFTEPAVESNDIGTDRQK